MAAWRDFLTPLPATLHQAIPHGRIQATWRRLPALFYVIPGKAWATDFVGREITGRLRSLFGWEARCVRQPYLARSQVLHYGEMGAFLHFARQPSPFNPNPSNQVVATIFHGTCSLEWSPDLARATARFLDLSRQARRIVTASRLMEKRLVDWGIPTEQLIRLPLGVDLQRFQPADPAARQAARRRLGIPPDVFCLGSFQKDGQGWGEGLEPKLIKGPDLFLEVVRRLQKHFPLFILLTGPARGYVRRGLESLGVPYTYFQPGDYGEMPGYYQALDLYLVASREEGGPQAVLEAPACGIPLVTTSVGMAPEVIQPGENGFLVPVEDTDALAQAAARLLEDPELRQHLAIRGPASVLQYDWGCIASRYFRQLYLPLLIEALQH